MAGARGINGIQEHGRCAHGGVSGRFASRRRLRRRFGRASFSGKSRAVLSPEFIRKSGRRLPLHGAPLVSEVAALAVRVGVRARVEVRSGTADPRAYVVRTFTGKAARVKGSQRNEVDIRDIALGRRRPNSVKVDCGITLHKSI